MIPNADAQRIGSRLKLYFALLSCLGGLVLTSGTSVESISYLAIFFAAFGYVFVDWLGLFALPPIAAYAAMGLAALYCVSDFVDLDAPGNHQMVAVAQLLVFVQGILMMQRKTRRILEQLGVFCLLQLIVAAVFNNAINFGLILVPISIIGAWALTSLAALSASEGVLSGIGIEDDDGHRPRSRDDSTSVISIVASQSSGALAKTSLRLPRFTIMTVAPAVLLVGTIFFYALPRTTEAARGNNPGQALVGFSDELRLEQIGEMMQSSQIALRVWLTNRATGGPYIVDDGLYLRGRVLERYAPQKDTAVWHNLNEATVNHQKDLPLEFVPRRSTDDNFYDVVEAKIVSEASRSDALFAIPPYHRVRSEPEIEHCSDRWTIGRLAKTSWNHPRISYEWGTHAFRRGTQSDLVAQVSSVRVNPDAFDRSENRSKQRLSSEVIASYGDALRLRTDEERRHENYVKALLKFDRDAMAETARLAEMLADSVSGRRKNDYQIAKAMESHLASSGEFGYTLKLDADRYPGMDPTEQFVLIDKKGHCQFFASALVMMLRSQGIPSRIVVGYHTDEYNEIGNNYVARQLHAHAWVEALINRDQLDRNRNVYGQPEAGAYWLRLDPTPGTGRMDERAGGVGEVFDLAQNMWDDYVVDMDGTRQEKAFLGNSGINPMHRSYVKFVEKLGNIVRRVRAGELGGGSLAGRSLFSWPAAVLGVGLTLLAVVLFRMPTPVWLRGERSEQTSDDVAEPKIAFYSQTLSQLSRTGIRRVASQTPSELASDATTRLQHPQVPSIGGPLAVLTEAFYRHRFGQIPDLEIATKSGHDQSDAGQDVQDALHQLTQSVDLMIIGQNAAERKA
ncbi:Protein-glutamine gamma-glutamyltransferase [Rubripirellula tenax]|uniref:Protein-glutamine gamma-glutamyltransferase n=1 Tax=Rubripirellula tenax TaxID=2528015 RepID=A0A5C6ECV8_9BACT|nr:DUF3488 and transglutaminase-like domain-containing protein [Rubripirellula tenax]TWU46315.1 Protein-glutamine gamma-glutamyltransferase [Rubripirellula tenax]